MSYRIEREVGFANWEEYSTDTVLSDAIFQTEEAFMQDHLVGEFYVYRILDENGVEVYRSS